jgi:hypothetical protein
MPERGLDRTVFTREIALLAERFNRDLTGPVIALYYDMLSHQLSTDEFTQACRALFFGGTFFPRPAELIHAVRGSAEDRAQLEWMELLEKHNRGERANLSHAGREAYKAIGGHYAMQSQDGGILKRDFTAAYMAVERQLERAILPALVEGEGESE